MSPMEDFKRCNMGPFSFPVYKSAIYIHIRLFIIIYTAAEKMNTFAEYIDVAF